MRLKGGSISRFFCCCFMKVVFYSQSILCFGTCTQPFMTNSVCGTAAPKTMTQEVSGVTEDFTTTYGYMYSWSINCLWADVIASAVSICPCDVVYFKTRC